MGPKSEVFQQCQRIQVAKDAGGSAVTISLERFDTALGWYTAGALSVPLCQLPLLEQALQDLSVSTRFECEAGNCPRKVIPFPLLMPEVAAETGS